MNTMGFRIRKRIRVGPFTVNLSRSGVSTSLRAGPATINPRRRSAWINLPGPAYWTRTLPKRRPR